ncbi:hypothetical protein [Actinoplanes couchii]|uniref:hypothetical protein n=1 Tax=Actinoplanes couchii TaxID=403638 RepID=UPI001943AD78|nr:hypothetical protein [Actinoplanes couchii]MDR6319149.1 hypothetical protein [Actinoplanes couchii]
MTIIPGYDDSGPALDGPGLAFDGAALLDLPGFWPAHLGGHLMLDLDEAAAFFGDDPVQTRLTYDRLTDTAAWPVFFCDAGNGARLAVVYRNFDEDHGVDYLLLPDGGPAITVGVDEGGFSGRGLTWTEVAGIAGRQPGERARATVLLLLAPALTRIAADAEDQLAAALRTVGVTGDAAVIAARILRPDYDDDDEDEDPADEVSLLISTPRPRPGSR